MSANITSVRYSLADGTELTPAFIKPVDPSYAYSASTSARKLTPTPYYEIQLDTKIIHVVVTAHAYEARQYSMVTGTSADRSFSYDVTLKAAD